MLRKILGAVAGIVVWTVLVVAFDFVLRNVWHDYAAVEKAMAFTVPMMAARLAMSGAGSLVSGAVAASLGRDRFTSALIAGATLLVIFLPIHYSIWAKFPIWYHLTFLTSLPVLSVVGGRFGRA